MGVQVWKFIMDREVEAPERFRAIQTYRATMAVLKQQAAFVKSMYNSGVVDDMEEAELLRYQTAPMKSNFIEKVYSQRL